MFLSLGIKGAGKSVSALSNVHKGLGEVKSVGFGAKAAIAAAVFGLERLMSSSVKTGTGLLNFVSITGLSSRKLQEWQHAAVSAGADAGELQSSVESVQKSMVDMLMGKGAPEGLGLIADAVGFDIEKADNAFYVMEQLQKFAQTARADVANTVLSQFGLSSNIIAAMRRGVFNEEAFKGAPVYSDDQLIKLNKADAMWGNLGRQIKFAVGEFSSDQGAVLVKELSEMVKMVLQLAKAFTKLSDNAGFFTLLKDSIGGLTQLFEMYTKIAKGFAEKGFLGGMLDVYKGAGEGALGAALTLKDAVVGTLSKETASVGNFGPGGTINQVLNFNNDGSNALQVSDSVKKATSDAFRQLPSNLQEN